MRVTIARLGSVRSTTVRATLGGSNWTARAALAKGRYRLTVQAVATSGARGTAARTTTVTRALIGDEPRANARALVVATQSETRMTALAHALPRGVSFIV